ncbi:deoxyribodipyrimidine photo-lyase [Paracoccus sp. p4-l81]|uniref:cryptochrome/photolyase family protein n=1 Tax=Paracoccus sp. p4-l81 TaxID=3342806 RepID=UPI0035B8D225
MTGALVWFRRDLRLADNPAISAAGPGWQGVFILDDALLAQGAASTWRLAQGLAALDKDLRVRGGALWIGRGDPAVVLADLAARTGARAVHANAWPAPAQRPIDRAVGEALAQRDIRLTLHSGAFLVSPGRVLTGDGRMYQVYSAFARALWALDPPDASGDPVPAPAASHPQPEALAALIADLSAPMNRGAAVLADHALPAGADAARDRLAAFLDGPLPDYAAGRDRADRTATSELAEALAVGEISPRRILADTRAAIAARPALAKAGQTFLSELVWREFAWHLLYDRPDMETAEWRPEWQGFPWQGASEALTAWQRGRTGQALVDAGMRELFATGRMHNRIRMVVASYLTKHLLTDWRLGMAWFADTLTDWDPASNAMNWQWVAGCGPDAAPYFRIFNPLLQADKADPSGAYTRRWLTHPDVERAAPRSWHLPDPRRRPPPLIDLAQGRARALAVFQDWKARQVAPPRHPA